LVSPPAGSSPASTRVRRAHPGCAGYLALGNGGLPRSSAKLALGVPCWAAFTETALDRVGSLSSEAPSGGFDCRRRHIEQPAAPKRAPSEKGVGLIFRDQIRLCGTKFGPNPLHKDGMKQQGTTHVVVHSPTTQGSGASQWNSSVSTCAYVRIRLHPVHSQIGDHA
jgi:hypothetical protein